MYTAESSALFDAFFIDFREEQQLEVFMCNTKALSRSRLRQISDILGRPRPKFSAIFLNDRRCPAVYTLLVSVPNSKHFSFY
ncbi:hypothetical protein T11_1059 [Trichinella zimbabwensis]|uniref:Uncharacterized protein n=1 Tax=Trichinella zimbabwensis TaxID=268475 RepID=A0A0V1I303_9BILA|nr:hypothetical protein T11_1059 [Trichinella zimbabwensis]